MTIAIIGHISRAGRVAELQRACPGSVAFIDDGTLGAAGNHLRALRHAADAGEPLLTIEDDAILTTDFGPRVQAWITRFPDRLISFYLGTGHPPAWQPEIIDRMGRADAAGIDFLELEQLIHGVCFYLPNPAAIAPLVQPKSGADFMTGDAWRKVTGLPMIYPTTSLVDHQDTDSVDKDPSVLAIMDPRHAWRLA